MKVINNKTENSCLLAVATGHACMTNTHPANALGTFSEFGKIDRILQVR